MSIIRAKLELTNGDVLLLPTKQGKCWKQIIPKNGSEGRLSLRGNSSLGRSLNSCHYTLSEKLRLIKGHNLNTSGLCLCVWQAPPVLTWYGSNDWWLSDYSVPEKDPHRFPQGILTVPWCRRHTACQALCRLSVRLCPENRIRLI